MKILDIHKKKKHDIQATRNNDNVIPRNSL